MTVEQAKELFDELSELIRKYDDIDIRMALNNVSRLVAVKIYANEP